MAIRQSAIDKIAYRNRKPKTRMERGLYDGYNSLPGEILTIKPRYRSVSSDTRTIYGAQNIYHLGLGKPNYPVPATIENADMASSHRWLTGHCPYNNGPCINCIENWLEDTAYHYGVSYD